MANAQRHVQRHSGSNKGVRLSPVLLKLQQHKSFPELVPKVASIGQVLWCQVLAGLSLTAVTAPRARRALTASHKWGAAVMGPVFGDVNVIGFNTLLPGAVKVNLIKLWIVLGAKCAKVLNHASDEVLRGRPEDRQSL